MKEKKLKEVFVTDVNEYPYLHEILDDEDVENLKIFKKDKKIIPFNYLTKKQFKEILDDEDSQAKVIGNVRLRDKYHREVKNKNQKTKTKKKSNVIGCFHTYFNDEYIEKHPNEEFNETHTYELNLYKPKDTSCIGYAYIGNNKFVRIENEHYFFVFLLIMIMIAAVVLGVYLIPKIDINKSKDFENGDYTSPNSFNLSYENNIQFDFVNHYTIDKEHTYLPIGNPEKNQFSYKVKVYLVKPDDISKKNYLTTIKDSDGNDILCFDMNKNGIVDKNESVVDELVWETKLIEPGGNPAKVELYDILPKGTYYLAFKYSLSQKDGTDITAPDNQKYSVQNGFTAITTTIDVVK